MRQLNLCVPVVKRYDLLHALLRSVERSEVKPTLIYIINNGQRPFHDILPVPVPTTPTVIHTPTTPMGVAESWNWFIDHTAEDRVIVNDDIILGPEALGILHTTPGDLLTGRGVGFSCFVIRDSCVQLVGKFDETISPGYAYFEDCDYVERLKRTAAVWTDVLIPIEHRNSSTWTSGTPAEVAEHWRKFHIAKANFHRKWPDTEVAR